MAGWPCACGGEYCQSPGPGRCLRCSNFLPADQIGTCHQCGRILCLTCLPIVMDEATKKKPDQTMLRTPFDDGTPL